MSRWINENGHILAISEEGEILGEIKDKKAFYKGKLVGEYLDDESAKKGLAKEINSPHNHNITIGGYSMAENDLLVALSHLAPGKTFWDN